jgi:hypothetical protein
MIRSQERFFLWKHDKTTSETSKKVGEQGIKK